MGFVIFFVLALAILLAILALKAGNDGRSADERVGSAYLWLASAVACVLVLFLVVVKSIFM